MAGGEQQTEQRQWQWQLSMRRKNHAGGLKNIKQRLPPAPPVGRGSHRPTGRHHCRPVQWWSQQVGWPREMGQGWGWSWWSGSWAS